MPSRPQPSFPEADTKAYWDAIKDNKLTYQAIHLIRATYALIRITRIRSQPKRSSP